MPKFIMLCGLPCSGKSTFANIIQQEFKSRGGTCVIASSDNYIEFMAQQHGKTYNDVFKQYIKMGQDHVNNLVQRAAFAREQENIIWDQTNLDSSTRHNRAALIPSGYQKICVSFDEPMHVILERNKNRPGKFIPENILESMQNKYTMPTIHEGFNIICRYNAGSMNNIHNIIFDEE